MSTEEVSAPWNIWRKWMNFQLRSFSRQQPSIGEQLMLLSNNLWIIWTSLLPKLCAFIVRLELDPRVGLDGHALVLTVIYCIRKINSASTVSFVEFDKAQLTSKGERWQAMGSICGPGFSRFDILVLNDQLDLPFSTKIILVVDKNCCQFSMIILNVIVWIHQFHHHR